MQVRSLVTVLVSLVCFGCPLGLSEPLSPVGSELLDEQLLGQWVAIPVEGEKHENGRVSVFRFDSSEYYLEFSEEGAVEDRMAAHISVIAGQKFLNVRDIEDPNGLYNFARYTVSADGDLSFQFIKDDLFPDGQTSAKAVRKLVEDDPRYPGLFDPNAIRLRRVR